MGDNVRRDAADDRAAATDAFRDAAHAGGAAVDQSALAADHALVQTVPLASDTAVLRASAGSDRVTLTQNREDASSAEEQGAPIRALPVGEDVQRDSAEDVAMKHEATAPLVSSDVRQASAEDKGEFINTVARHASQDQKYQSRRFTSSIPAPTLLEDAWLWRRSDFREARVTERYERQRHRREKETFKSHMKEHEALRSRIRERLANASGHGNPYGKMPSGAASIRHLRVAALAAQHVSAREKWGEAAHVHHLEDGIESNPVTLRGHHARSSSPEESLSLIHVREAAAELLPEDRLLDERRSQIERRSRSTGAQIEELWR
jgi:hypothetical protein